MNPDLQIKFVSDRNGFFKMFGQYTIQTVIMIWANVKYRRPVQTKVQMWNSPD